MCEASGQRSAVARRWQGTLATYSPRKVDRIWLWAYYHKIPIYPMFYLLKGTIGFYGDPRGLQGSNQVLEDAPLSERRGLQASRL